MTFTRMKRKVHNPPPIIWLDYSFSETSEPTLATFNHHWGSEPSDDRAKGMGQLDFV